MRQTASKTASATPAVAALDLGTNSFLLLLLRETAGGALERVSEPCRIVRLGQGVDRTGRLAPEAIARGLRAIRELLAETAWAGTAGVGIAAATSAVRDAANRDEFLAPCAELLGGRPVLLSGDNEARTVFTGASSELAPGQAGVCVDIGGGSTELAAGFPGDYRAGLSVNVGCVRLAERFGLENAAARMPWPPPAPPLPPPWPPPAPRFCAPRLRTPQPAPSRGRRPPCGPPAAPPTPPPRRSPPGPAAASSTITPASV
jgi:exopolyphosphatase/guanosine-5'-triphosphate,3'-diphosphate pyrophosphatase